MINWGTSSGCIFNSLSLETSRPTAPPQLPVSPLHSLCQPTRESAQRPTVSWHWQARIASETLLKALCCRRHTGLFDMCDSWGRRVAKWTETGRMAWPTSIRATLLSLHKPHRCCSATCFFPFLCLENIQQAKAYISPSPGNWKGKGGGWGGGRRIWMLIWRVRWIYKPSAISYPLSLFVFRLYIRLAMHNWPSAGYACVFNTKSITTKQQIHDALQRLIPEIQSGFV